MNVGDKVRSIGECKGIIGVVEAIYDWSEHGPLSVQNHGIIEIRIESIQKGTWSWATVGGLEHFVVYQWEKHLELLS
jgi:hypothetical protein